MPKIKDPKKKKITTDKERKRISRGQKRYMLASDIKEEAESYESQSQEEAEKAKSRSLWATVGGVVGAAAGLVAAPIIVPFIAGAGAGALATGVITGATVGAGSAGFGHGFKKGMEEYGGKKRKDIKVDKFYTSAAEEATETFKSYDEKIDESIGKQAVISGLLAGAQAGGLFKKAGSALKEGLGVGEKTSAVAADMSYATEAVAEVPLASVDKAVLEQSVAKPMLTDVTSPFGPASDRSLYAAVKQNLFSTALTGGYSAMKNRGPQYSQIEEPDYTSIT